MLTQDYIEAKQDLDLALRAEPNNRCAWPGIILGFHYIDAKRRSLFFSFLPVHNVVMPIPTPVLAWSALVCGRRASVTDLAKLELQTHVQTW